MGFPSGELVTLRSHRPAEVIGDPRPAHNFVGNSLGFLSLKNGTADFLLCRFGGLRVWRASAEKDLPELQSVAGVVSAKPMCVRRISCRALLKREETPLTPLTFRFVDVSLRQIRAHGLASFSGGAAKLPWYVTFTPIYNPGSVPNSACHRVSTSLITGAKGLRHPKSITAGMTVPSPRRKSGFRIRGRRLESRILPLLGPTAKPRVLHADLYLKHLFMGGF